jgi:MerR family transcriptional regulator, light-induced transcriptional regulator
MNQMREQTGQAILEDCSVLAREIVARQYWQQPELLERYGARGREVSIQDATYHLTYLAESLSAAEPSLFTDYISWARTLFAGLGLSDKVLATALQTTRDVLQEMLPDDLGNVADPYLVAGLDQLRQELSEPSASALGGPLAGLAAAYLDTLLQSDRHRARWMIQHAIDRGAGIHEIYLDVFEPVQHEIGRLWQTGQLGVAQEHFCSAATQWIMAQLYPYVVRFRAPRIGRRLAVICVGGELHEIGARMVADFCELAGWTTDYLGANVPATGLARALSARGTDVLAISATMTFHFSAVRELITALRATETGNTMPILVGGRLFNTTPELWRRVGADGWARDAREAIVTLRDLAPRETPELPSVPRGSAWLCNTEGRVLEVLRNDLGWLEAGENLPEAVESGGVELATEFLTAVHTRGQVIDWTLPVPLAGGSQSLHFAGFAGPGQTLVAAARRRPRLRQVCQELANSQPAWAGALRRTLNEWAELAARAPKRGARLYYELSRLNSELVNLQRELALKNAELQQKSGER